MERMRLNERGVMTGDTFFDGENRLIIGPKADYLYPYLATDNHNYTSPLKSLELREMLASSIFATLPDAHKFTTIVGEDTSGRFPGLIAAKTINRLRSRNNLEPAKVRFLSGRIDDDKLPHFRPKNENEAVLLVTELISSGCSAESCMNALKTVGYEDISILTIDRIPPNLFSLPVVLLDGPGYYMGDTSRYTGKVVTHLHSDNMPAKGVYKVPGDAYAKAKKMNPADRKLLVKSREDIEHFVTELVDIWDIRS